MLPSMTITATDLSRLAILSVGIVALLLLTEAARRRMGWPDEVSRKSVHVATGILIFFAPPYFPRAGAIVLIATLFVLANAAAYAGGWLRAVHHSTRKSFGTVYYPFALLVLALFMWEGHAELVAAAILVMALGDGAAGIVGESIPTPRIYRVTADPKSLQGSAAMFAGSLIALLAMALLYGDMALFNGPLFLPLLALPSVALFATAWEAASSRGLDNLSVPIMTALALHISLVGHGDALALQFVIGSALGLFVGITAYALRMLKASGAVATYLLATVLYSIGGWQWTLPIFSFFLLSSLLSKWRKARKARFDSVFDKGGTRDAGQVAANGALAGLLAIVAYVFGGEHWYLLSLVAVSSVTADTWGTEIGVLARQQPRSIRSGRTVPAGTSGGITIAGTAGGLLGAALVTATAFLFIDMNMSTYALIVALGVTGSLADSLLGATVQAQYHCALCGHHTEKRFHCAMPARRVGGYRHITNDAVNLLSSLAAVLLGAALLSWLQG